MKFKAYKITLFIMVILLSGCVVLKTHRQKTIEIDKVLLKKSDYIDIVYEDGMFSRVNYIKEEPPRELNYNVNCPIQETHGEVIRGIWLWDFKKVAGNEKQVIDFLKEWEIKRVYLQIGDDLEIQKDFLKMALKDGIEIFALEGSSEYVNNYSILSERLKSVIEFNRKNMSIKFRGFQINVEPHIMRDFNINREEYMRKYVKLIKSLQRHLRGEDMLLSIVIPFWFDEISYEGIPLAYRVIDMADEVAIMSYRTDPEEMLSVAYNELCYAFRRGKPVYLGVEVNRLPTEEHFLIKRSEAKRVKENDLPYFKKYTVMPERLSFFDNIDGLYEILKIMPTIGSFSGFVINSYEGLDSISTP